MTKITVEAPKSQIAQDILVSHASRQEALDSGNTALLVPLNERGKDVEHEVYQDA